MKKSVKNRLVFLFPIVILVALTVLSLIPPEAIPSTHGWFSRIPYNDKIVHFCFYFALASALRFTKTYTFQYNKVWQWRFLIFAALYGGLIEILQGQFFSRGCEIWDEAANVTGAVAAIWLIPQRWHEWLADQWGRRLGDYS